MPRLKGVSKEDVGGTIAKYYQALFGDRDPVKEPELQPGPRELVDGFSQRFLIYLIMQQAILVCLVCFQIKA